MDEEPMRYTAWPHWRVHGSLGGRWELESLRIGRLDG